jgi:hypothetical protein
VRQEVVDRGVAAGEGRGQVRGDTVQNLGGRDARTARTQSIAAPLHPPLRR